MGTAQGPLYILAELFNVLQPSSRVCPALQKKTQISSSSYQSRTLCPLLKLSILLPFSKVNFLILLFPPSLCTTEEASNCVGPESSSFGEFLGFLLFLASFCGFSGKRQVGIHTFWACSVLWSTQEMACLWNYCPGPQQKLKVSALLPTAISDVLGEGTYFPHTSAVAQMQM